MLNATLVGRTDVTSELTIFRVKPDKAIEDFEPGQYVALGLPGTASRPAGFPPEPTPPDGDKLIKRAYSIGSPPSEKGYLEFYIAIVPTGALTSRLANLKEGDRLFCATKITGTFTLADVPSDANLCLVATGTGLAPYMSMMRSNSIWTPGRRISVLHGVRFSRDLAYRDEIEKFAECRTDVSYYPFVSREDPRGQEFRRGYVQSLFKAGELALDPSRDHVFLCGNPAMIDDVEELLTSRGYVVHSKKTPGSLHLERYW